MKLGLLVLIGVPGSGKTTLAKILKKNFNTFNEEKYLFVHICYDNLIPPTCQNLELEYKILRKLVAVKIENFVSAVKLRKKENCPEEFSDDFDDVISTDLNTILIIDDNMYFRSMRYILYQIAKQQNLGFCQVFLNCCLETALFWNSERNINCMIPPHKIENMYLKLEPPSSKNGWEKFSLVFDSFSNVNEFYKKLAPLLCDSLNNLESVKSDSEEKLLSSLENRKNVVHQSDIALRKIVGSKIKDFVAANSNYSMQQYSSHLKSLRHEILNDIRLKNISLPEEVLEEIDLDIKHKNMLISFLNSYF